MMDLVSLLNDYLKRIGQDEHAISSAGSLFELTLNDVFSIRVSQLAGPPAMICFEHEVGPVPLNADNDFFRRCLHANFQARSAFDAVIAINEANSTLALLARYPLADLDGERFHTMLEDFSVQAQRLHTVIADREYMGSQPVSQTSANDFLRA